MLRGNLINVIGSHQIYSVVYGMYAIVTGIATLFAFRFQMPNQKIREK